MRTSQRGRGLLQQILWHTASASLLVVAVTVLVGCSAIVTPVAYRTQVSVNTGAVVAVVGDVQRTSVLEVWREHNNKERRLLLRELAAEKPTALVMLGDQVFWGSSTDDWEYFDEVMKPIAQQNIPVLPILGNHEYYGSDEQMLRNLSSRFASVTDQPRYVVIDSVAWIFLNTNVTEIGVKQMEKQRRWFLKTLSQLDTADSVRFINVCGHHPPFTNSTVVLPDQLLQSFFVPAFLTARKTAFWFSGHAHAYERFALQNKQFIVSGGGGGPRQRVLQGAWARYADEYEAPSLRPLHYCKVSREMNVIRCEMIPLRNTKYLTDHAVVVGWDK